MKKRTICIETAIAGFAVAAVVGCKMLNEKENDDAKLHTEDSGEVIWRQDATFYEKFVKRALDIGISFCGLIVSAPVLAVASAVVFIEDPGKVVFRQKRVGIHKTYFYIHKLRSMRENKGDVPTHLLSGEDQKRLILKSGAFFRKTSIDELYQLIDTLRGRMSIVGPRPALWNQDDLVAERDKYGANDVRPGITGWAQINGRDELPIPVKAKLDGYYTERLKKSSLSGFAMDCRCFFGTVRSVLKHDGVVEGGTGSKSATAGGIGARDYTAGVSERELIGKIGFDNPVNVVHNKKRRVLITGAGSYIGEAFERYAKERYADDFAIDTLDMTDEGWREADFAPYDIVYHVAGLAHADVGNVSAETREKYYRVNTDLAVETAQKAKASGVKEFVFMSSMIVYGESSPYGTRKVVEPLTAPKPANFYGDSKLQADVAVRALADGTFKVAVLRPPMIYGRGSKGNYPMLAKLAKKMPVFPQVENERSMLYIENLCEFLCQLFLVDEAMFDDEGNVFFPQNGTYTCTSDMVEAIAGASGHKIRMVKLLAAAVRVAGMLPGKIGAMTNKAFGNSCYETEMSRYEGLDYQVVGVEESVRRTEKDCPRKERKKKVLFLVNHDIVIYNFRRELVERLLAEGYDVSVSSPYGERIEDLKAMGCHYYPIEIDRHGMNPWKELRLLCAYEALYSKVRPDVVLGYTIKPNIYGALAAQHRRIPFIANITGLGTAVENGGYQQRIFVLLYQCAFRKVRRVFFQNEENRQFFIDNHIAVEKHDLIPGSGVNLERFPVREYPDDVVVKFLFISRIMKEKGIDQYLEAAKAVRKKYANVEFHVCGFCEAEYEGQLRVLHENGTVIYHGMIREVSEFLKDMHCVVHPTYYPEGISNVLLEACASGRPIITTDRSGCREALEDGVNGLMVRQKDSEDLIRKINYFMSMSNEQRKQMGLAGRRKVEREFDRRIVVDRYMKEIGKI